jgi:DNA-binding NarL/FixJ family response regulator
MARILLADCRRLFNEVLSVLLTRNGEHQVVGWRSSPDAILTAVEQFQPDLVLVDAQLALPGRPCLVERLRDEHPEVKVLLIAAELDVQLVVTAVRAGVLGVVEKTSGTTTVLRAIKAAVAGEGIVPRAMLPEVFRELAGIRHQAAASPLNRLSAREREVLALLSQGMGNASIGSALRISPHTVRTHIQNILEKLDMHSRLEVATFAMQQSDQLTTTPLVRFPAS